MHRTARKEGGPMKEEEVYNRLDQLEDIVRIAEEKNEDDNAALAREVSKLWEAVHEINGIIDNKLPKSNPNCCSQESWE